MTKSQTCQTEPIQQQASRQSLAEAFDALRMLRGNRNISTKKSTS